MGEPPRSAGLHGVNEIYVTIGTDAVYYQLLQRYGYTADELRSWIPDPAHQLGWLLQTMSGGEFPITDALLQKRAALGRRIAAVRASWASRPCSRLLWHRARPTSPSATVVPT
jgi:hypothetical protein